MIGVLFDMDGVLVDSTKPHFEAFQKMAAIVGVPFSEELWARSIGMHNNQIFPLWLGSDLSPERVAELASEKEALYRSHAAETLKPVEGVIELIKALKVDGGFKLAVGSSGPRENVELALKIIGVKASFDAVITGSDVKHGKPDPEIFLKAASSIGLSPDACIVIEDAPQGVNAALNAKMRVIAVTTSTTKENLVRATTVVSSLKSVNPHFIRALLA